MSFRKRLVLLFLILLAVGALDALCAPFLVARGVRLWVEWAARRQGLSVTLGAVEAPFLRPVTLHQLRFTSAAQAPREVALQIETLVVDLNLRGWIFRQPKQLLASVRADQITARVRVPQKASPGAKLDWKQFARLLPDNFRLRDLNLEVATFTTAVKFQGVQLSASAIESGKFFAHQITVTSPVLRQTFTDLRGATSWENSRLTIAGIPLARGLDLEALTLDLSRLERRRLGIDLHLDTFGGTLRASFQGRAGNKFAIDLAGSAANLSLAQISSAIGFLEPVTGSVRASKFTFRGNPGEFLDATASIWMEATDFAWRARQAESVMLGATFYDRRLEVDQLYVRQRQNELTVNGELLWPKRRGSWWQLPFRGRLNATIPDLNALAQFFGATTGDFSGALRAEGEFDLVDPAASGRLTCRGEGVKFRGVALDSLGGSLRLHGQEANLEDLEARHGEDFLRASGTFELNEEHRFSGRLTGAIDDLGTYAPLLPTTWRAGHLGGGATFDWQGDGTFAAHSGTVQLFAHGLQLPIPLLRAPLDLTLVGSYSPQDVFFRTFRLASDQFSLGGYLTLGSDFIELQSFELALAGAPRVSGTAFLPWSFNSWRKSRSLLDALDEKQKFDVDLAMIHLDLAQLLRAIGSKSSLSGVLDGKLAAFGSLPTLQLTTDLRMENLGPATNGNALRLQAHLADGRVEADGSAQFGVSDPVTLRTSLPLVLKKNQMKAGRILDRSAPASLVVESPALFLEALPNEWRRGATGGLLSGNFKLEGKLAAPTISGGGSLLGASFVFPPPWPALNNVAAQIQFHDREMLLESLQVEVNSIPLALRGRLTTDGDSYGLTLQPESGVIEMVQRPKAAGALSAMRLVSGNTAGTDDRLREVVLRGSILPWSVTSLTTRTNAAAASSYFLRAHLAESGPLLLRLVPPEPTMGPPQTSAR